MSGVSVCLSVKHKSGEKDEFETMTRAKDFSKPPVVLVVV
jgi:hypothetical protein